MIAFGDGGTAKKGNLPGETKKAQVLRLAQRDPFLSVDEIAKHVGTTSRYVRTSLCEAGLTLTGLRRRYAADMRRRISNATGTKALSHRSVGRPSEVARGTARPAGIRVAVTIDSEAAALLGTDPHSPLLEISRVLVENGEPLCVTQLVTNHPLMAGERLLIADEPLHTLLDLATLDPATLDPATLDHMSGNLQEDIDGEDKTQAWPVVSDKRIVDIVPATGLLAESLGLISGHPILRSGTVITIGQHPVAVEYKYFDGMRVRFELDSATRREPQVTERVRRTSNG